MDIESSNSASSRQQNSQSSGNSFKPSRGLFALIDEHHSFTPYRSNFELNSIGSGKSRQSRDSDLLNRLAKDSSKASSKSLSRNVSDTKLEVKQGAKEDGESHSNSGNSENSSGQAERQYPKIEAHMMAPKIHNCVCFVAGQCLSYNCNCFLSPFPCTPECCPNCLTLKTNLPHKVTNVCSCKKTRCLKLYCQCLSKGIYCGVMCRCELCQNHENSASRMRELAISNSFRGCSCQKSHCVRKYCECFNRQLKCTPKCGCFNCHNMISTINQPEKKETYEEMDIQEQELQFQQIDFFGTRKK